MFSRQMGGDLLKNLLDKILAMCDGCNYFNISIDGNVEYYECYNEDKWLSLGFTEEEIEEFDKMAIAIVEYDDELNPVYVEICPPYLNLDHCEFKEVSK